MPSRIVKVLIPTLLIIAIFSYIFVLNPGSVTLNYWGGRSWTSPLGIVVTVVFCFGATVAAILAFFLTAKHTFQDWKRDRGIRRRDERAQLLTRGREQLAMENFGAAQSLFERVIAGDPTNVVARILLAKVYRRRGDLPSAVKVLEEARQTQRPNLELLFLAADIQEELGNLTGALDNFSLVRQHEPQNLAALKRLAELCEQMNRLDEAVEFQSEVVRLSPGAGFSAEQARLAHLRFLIAMRNRENNQAHFRQSLEAILREHKDYPDALLELARLDWSSGRYQQATKFWTRAFRATHDVRLLEQAASHWLTLHNPQGAIEYMRNATSSLPDESPAYYRAQLALVRLLLNVEMIAEAKVEMDKLRMLGPPSTEQEREFAVLEARLLQRDGRYLEAYTLLLRLLGENNNEERLLLKQGGQSRHPLQLIEAPSPQLSTP